MKESKNPRESMPNGPIGQIGGLGKDLAVSTQDTAQASYGVNSGNIETLPQSNH